MFYNLASFEEFSSRINFLTLNNTKLPVAFKYLSLMWKLLSNYAPSDFSSIYGATDIHRILNQWYSDFDKLNFQEIKELYDFDGFSAYKERILYEDYVDENKGENINYNEYENTYTSDRFLNDLKHIFINKNGCNEALNINETNSMFCGKKKILENCKNFQQKEIKSNPSVEMTKFQSDIIHISAHQDKNKYDDSNNLGIYQDMFIDVCSTSSNCIKQIQNYTKDNFELKPKKTGFFERLNEFFINVYIENISNYKTIYNLLIKKSDVEGIIYFIGIFESICYFKYLEMGEESFIDWFSNMIVKFFDWLNDNTYIDFLFSGYIKKSDTRLEILYWMREFDHKNVNDDQIFDKYIAFFLLYLNDNLKEFLDYYGSELSDINNLSFCFNKFIATDENILLYANKKRILNIILVLINKLGENTCLDIFERINLLQKIVKENFSFINDPTLLIFSVPAEHLNSKFLYKKLVNEIMYFILDLFWNEFKKYHPFYLSCITDRIIIIVNLYKYFTSIYECDFTNDNEINLENVLKL